MCEEFKISYETVGASSYMAITLLPEAQLVHYQLEMMVANKIKNLLQSFKRVNNGEMVLYYNITSLIPLSQVLAKRKLMRDEFIRLVEGAIYAIRDIAEYRLPEKGLLMSADYIYVNPSSCDPNFIFIPIENENSMTLKSLIQDLVMRGKIELTQDNFIQSILEVLNENVFSIDHMEQCLQQFRSNTNRSQRVVMQKEPVQKTPIQKTPFQQVPIQQVQQQRTPVQKTPIQQNQMQQEPVQKTPVQKTPIQKNPIQSSSQGIPVQGIRPPQKVEPDRRKKLVFEREEPQKEDGFDPEKAKKMFVLPQAIIMIVVSAAISFGWFVDGTGALAFKNILAAGIIIVVVEIILYREAYVNSRKKTEKTQKTSKKPGKTEVKKQTGKRPVINGESAGRQVVPESAGKEKQQLSNGVQQPAAFGEKTGLGGAPQNYSAMEPTISPEFRTKNTVTPMNVQPSVMIQRPIYGQEETDLGDETELWGESAVNTGNTSYLEYYENGNVIRIPLNHPNGVVIGRLRSQADFIVTNARVGKVHAKFYEQDGQYYVVDINSKNGTFINGREQRIQSNIPYPLHDNDRIMLADSEFVIRCPQR
ncbi:MAG: DUF6382 domain-containing protein [Brotaphodocola sp.]